MYKIGNELGLAVFLAMDLPFFSYGRAIIVGKIAAGMAKVTPVGPTKCLANYQ